MTAEEWDTCDDLSSMISALRGAPKTGRRNRLLLGTACCRTVWDFIALDESRTAVELAEKFADVLRPRKGLTQLRQSLRVRILASGGSIPADHAVYGLLSEEINVGSISHLTIIAAGRESREESVRLVQLAFLRDIFGNPFRPVAFDPAWRSESAVALARTAYESRNFSLLPILADALEEGGCDNPNILTHCRQPDAIHVRGCWVVDLVLGKN